MSVNAQYGRGFRFPMAPAGKFAMLQGAEVVDQALRTLLMTQPGERVGRPQWGCRLRSYRFQPNSVATRTLLRREVVEAITRFEARAQLQEVTVQADHAAPTRVTIDVRYRLADDPTPRTLVFPFYLQDDAHHTSGANR